MKSRIYIAIHREDLVAKGACASGLEEFDKLVGVQRESKDRWLIEWSPLFDVWLSVAYPGHSSWLREHGFIPRSALSGANLSGANLSRTDLYGANLYGANLSRADLSRADLSRANLYGADLSRADLSGADLYGANLSRADLSRADLYGANLSRADLSGADLSGAYGSPAALPDGFEQVNGIIREKAT